MEQHGKHPHRQEERGSRGDPAFAVERDLAVRDDHVDVRMLGECRTPGMEHGGDADAGAEMLRVGVGRAWKARSPP
jgi:hypothetical protein